MEKIKEANKANREIVEKHEKITAQRKNCAQKQKEVKNLLDKMNNKIIIGLKEDLKSDDKKFVQKDLGELSQEQLQNYVKDANKLINKMNDVLKHSK